MRHTNYPRWRMCLLDSVDAYWGGRTTFVATRLRIGCPLIPITINERTYWALIDMGACLFPLSTDEQT